jgi:hypothetical protein
MALRPVFMLMVLLLPLFAAAQDPVPSWIVEETSGTVRLAKPGKLPSRLQGSMSVPLYQGDRLLVGPVGRARVFDGRQVRHLVADAEAQSHVVPAPPAEGSVVGRLLADAARRQSHAAAAGVVIRVGEDEECRFLVPDEGRYFVGRAPDPVVLVTLEQTDPLALVIERRPPGDLVAPAEQVARLPIPQTEGSHTIAVPDDVWQPGWVYLLRIRRSSETLAMKSIEPASADVLAALEADRQVLLDELAAQGIKEDVTAPLAYLYAAHRFILPVE